MQTIRARVFFHLAAFAAFLLCLPITASSARAAPAAEGGVVVYYFHGTLRCETCLLIETLAEGTLQADFPEELANGRLVWRPLSVDLPENAHFVKDFGLGANELVVIRQHKDGGATWGKVPDIWNLAANPGRFSQRLREEVVRFLEMRI
ncbi:nitrophenyl compound nitroreductase subunit ArsF family protein [Geomobilimonas luticola]|uniref:Uncharacterized protein n=1 Tax=Geomobilimonas luticola TaxID=1114878 RepID=A0ABS5SCW4_9BACT|nr:nitrophenyl compound nitroreductase subunit ArsF family protein [Geomobilimonas luticola]MBT0653215.1 hypothetical protein [Geomobilimonas luticola]